MIYRLNNNNKDYFKGCSRVGVVEVEGIPCEGNSKYQGAILSALHVVQQGTSRTYLKIFYGLDLNEPPICTVGAVELGSHIVVFPIALFASW